MALKGAVYGSSPSTPPVGYRLFYPKSDGWYSKDETGVETRVESPALPLTILNGGTGSTTASGARTNLGAAAAGANSDITSLSGLTTALSIAQGGTSATSAGAARTALGAAAAGANSDITSLSGLTTALSVLQGGTGATTASGARSSLGAAASGANSDITSLSGLTTALSVAQGGTAATTAAGARTSLGAAASGANSDITSLSGLTTALSVLQGGTGATTAGGARTNLSAAASGANSDITSLTGLTTALSVAQGGTAATTAAGARTSLGAAASGANSDITSLSGLTTALSVAQGGTAATTAAGARTSLGAAASGANSDITSLSGLTTALSIAQGGTGATTALAAFNVLSPNTTKGDITARDTSNNIRIAVGTDGQLLTADTASSGGVKWATNAAAVVTDISSFFVLKDDFPDNGENTGLVGELGWQVQSSGTAATVVRKAGISGRPGIITLRPGTVVGGRAAISHGADGVNSLVMGDGLTELTFILRSNAVLSQLEMIVAGLGDVSNNVGDQTNGIYFQVLGSPTPDTNWFLVCANAGTRTRSDTGIAYAANAWVNMKFVVNAAGTSVQAFMNGSSAGSAITTNIPSVATSPIVKVDGIAGGVASDTDVDAFFMKKTLTSAR